MGGLLRPAAGVAGSSIPGNGRVALVLDARELTVRSMRTDLATYTTGFESVLRGISEGTITTPEAANDALVPFKDEIRRLDATSSDFATRNVEAMSAKGATVAEVAGRTPTLVRPSSREGLTRTSAPSATARSTAASGRGRRRCPDAESSPRSSRRSGS
jgi:hypothetical protein